MKTPLSRIRPLLVASLLSLPLTVLAQPGADRCDGNPPPHEQAPGGPGLLLPPAPHGAPFAAPLPPQFHGIQFTEAQEDKIFALVHAQAPRLRELAKTARKSRDELRPLSQGSAYDDAKAKSLAEAGAKAEAESALILARIDQQIAKLLTAEQRQQLEERKAARAKNGEKRPPAPGLAPSTP